ncbi:MAG: hypothetical protein FJ271_04420 [Planctomycetes bacterium]|nr:hypothetical protein [Planctomycetota bacterium]
MRYKWLALSTLLLAVAATCGQQTPPAASPAGNLDDVLVNWEKTMTGARSLLAFCTRTNVDKVYQTTELYEGTAKFVKGAAGQPSKASLEMVKKGRPDIFEKYIYTGRSLYEYQPGTKVIRVHDLPVPKPGQVADDNFVSFLFGMKAAEARKRYQLTLVPPPANDKWYYYVKIQPIQAADKADFTEARMVLTVKDYMPRQIWFQQPNGNETTWDFTRVINGADIRPSEFEKPALPARDWRYVEVPRETPARVIRQQQ